MPVERRKRGGGSGRAANISAPVLVPPHGVVLFFLFCMLLLLLLFALVKASHIHEQCRGNYESGLGFMYADTTNCACAADAVDADVAPVRRVCPWLHSAFPHACL